MTDERERALQILQANTGFDEPARWINYAHKHGFKRVKAKRVPQCPGCSANPTRTLGQYIYYSTLIHLFECERCRLIWANAHIDPTTIRQHFEKTYKSEEYFGTDRGSIFEHLAHVIDRLAPNGAAILDIGGAKGHLMAAATRRRPDLQATVHDLSVSATAYAREHYGFATVCGDVTTLYDHPRSYDLVVLSDVMYYEPKLGELWSLLPRLVRPHGSILIRVPNKLPLICLSQFLLRVLGLPRKRHPQDRIPFFNPEHIYIFTRRYLTEQLWNLGFSSVQVLPTPLIAGGGGARRMWFILASILSQLSAGTLVVTPSMVVVGTNRLEPQSSSRQTIY